MNCLHRILLAGVAALTLLPPALAQEPAAPPAAPPPVKVEFRWAESEPIAGVTEEQGRVWNESGDKIYVHKQPILTNKDIAEVRATKTVFGGSRPVEQFTVHFQLTKEARKRLAESCGPSGDGLLPVLVDGGSFGTLYYLKSRDEANFAPSAGFFSSKEKVDQIVATFAPAKPAPAKPVDK